MDLSLKFNWNQQLLWNYKFIDIFAYFYEYDTSVKVAGKVSDLYYICL